MSALVASAANTAATSIMGSAISSAAEKGVGDKKRDDMTTTEKSAIKVTELIISSVSTAIAITLFGHLTQGLSSRAQFIFIAVIVSVASAVVAAYLKVAL